MHTALTVRAALLLALSLALTGHSESAAFSRGAVASVNPLATRAGVDAMKRGGNAIDAAIATAITLGVVDGHNSGLGGGCFILIRASDGNITCLDGREMAPAAAHRDMYVINGKVDDEASKTGALASGVPGALAAYDLALRKHGKLKLRDLLLPAAQLADEGFTIDEVYARKLASQVTNLRKFPASAAVLLRADGSPLLKGDRLVQHDLANTLRAIAEHGIDWFYRGEFAAKTAAWMAAHGGIMTASDFTNYVVKEREPVRFHYRDHDLISMPPPSSGGLHVGQVLQMIERFDIARMPDADRVHVMTEAMKLAFADRAFWLGDPDFAKVPRGLLDRSYTDALSLKIDSAKATPVPQHGTPPKPHDDLFGSHTTHLSTADSDGNWVALTQTINTSFGSKVIVPGTGVIMNDEMDDFAVQPGVPNAFKLIGMEANSVQPGKRPLSCMSPTLVLKEGKPILSVGAAGGPTIITQTLLAISNIIDRHMNPEQALAAPRFHHQWMPDSLKVESTFGPDVLEDLQHRGHELEKISSFGACQCILLNEGKLFPAHDPRIPGEAAGW